MSHERPNVEVERPAAATLPKKKPLVGGSARTRGWASLRSYLSELHLLQHGPAQKSIKISERFDNLKVGGSPPDEEGDWPGRGPYCGGGVSGLAPGHRWLE